MLRLASLSTLALVSLLAACNNANIATGGTGGGGSGGGNGGGTTSSTTSTTTTTTSGTGGGNACTQAGGTCVALTPNPCPNGMIGDAGKYSCGPEVGVACCIPVECFDTCGTIGATQCTNGVIETCAKDSVGCTSWQFTSACAVNETCNADGTACVLPGTTCSTNADCGCGCGCAGGACHCTGGIPPSCATDSDCGPACSGLKCSAGKCVQPVCTPGQDQTCNEILAMQSFAGTCQVDGTCTCKQGFTKKADGKCGP
jgi:hypothetical protein